MQTYLSIIRQIAIVLFCTAGALCATAYAHSLPRAADSNLEFDNGTKGWQTVLDGVMGGLSTGRITNGSGGTLVFTGELSLENNGGFSQIRTSTPEGIFAGTQGLRMRVKGDGRTYQCDIRSSRVRLMAGGYQQLFETKAGEWIEVDIQFDKCTLNSFGQRVRNSAPLDPASIESVGVTISDKNPGPFALEIDWIRPIGVDTSTEQSSAGSLASVATKANLTTLLALVKVAELELPKGGRFTIFAPTNEAFAKLAKAQVEFLTSPAGKAALQTILKHHIVAQSLESSAVLERRRLTALSGQSLDIDPSKLTVDNAGLVATDVPFDNGLVHVIDAVMVPELRTIEEIVTVDTRFSTLRSAIETAGIGVQLGKTNPGPWTLLAPSNNAFAAVPADSLSALLKDKGALTSVLVGHVLPTAIRRDEMLSQGSARTLMGDGNVVFALTDGAITVDGAKIEVADIEAVNGVIHIIDRVLLEKKSESTSQIAMAKGNSQQIAAIFDLAIERGVPLFNAGDVASCAALYELALTAVVLLGNDAVQPNVRARLVDALKIGAANPDASERAWIFRRAIDRAMENMSG